MFLKNISLFVFICLISACTTMKYNGATTYVNEVDYPPIGKEITAYVGDHLVKKGSIIESGVLTVTERVDGFAYEIPVGKYPQTGSDEKNDYFVAMGVEKSALADPYQGLSVEKDDQSEKDDQRRPEEERRSETTRGRKTTRARKTIRHAQREKDDHQENLLLSLVHHFEFHLEVLREFRIVELLAYRALLEILFPYFLNSALDGHHSRCGIIDHLVLKMLLLRIQTVLPFFQIVR